MLGTCTIAEPKHTSLDYITRAQSLLACTAVCTDGHGFALRQPRDASPELVHRSQAQLPNLHPVDVSKLPTTAHPMAKVLVRPAGTVGG